MSTQARLIERALFFIFRQSHAYLQRLNSRQWMLHSRTCAYLTISRTTNSSIKSYVFHVTYLCQSTARSSSTPLPAPYNANQDMPKTFQIPKSCPCRQPGQLTRLGFRLGRRPFVLLTSCTDHLKIRTTIVTTSSELHVTNEHLRP